MHCRPRPGLLLILRNILRRSNNLPRHCLCLKWLRPCLTTRTRRYLSPQIPDCINDANAKVSGMCKILRNATNSDYFTKKEVNFPLAVNNTLALTMVGGGVSAIDEVAQLQAISRVMYASNPTKDTTFNVKWKKMMGTAVSSKRGKIFTLCAKWWMSSPAIEELSRASKALGIFELMLIAPVTFSNDH